MASKQPNDKGKSGRQGSSNDAESETATDEFRWVKDRWFSGWPEEYDVDGDGGAS